MIEGHAVYAWISWFALVVAACGNGSQGSDPVDDAGARADTSPPCTASWTIGDVDPDDAVSQANAIAIDSLGGLHVAYGSQTGLRYAHKLPADPGWSFEPISGGGVADTVHIAVDPQGVVHLSSFDFTNGLVYSERAPSGQWTSTAITPFVDGAGYNHSIAADAAGGVHVVYSSNVETYYAYRAAGGTFEITELSESMGSPADIKVDTSGTIHAVYSPCGTPCGSGYPLTYARRASGGEWQREIFDHNNMAEATMALAPNGDVYIGFYLFANPDDKLRLATRGATGWIVDHVDEHSYETGGRIAIAVDAAGGAHMLYYDESPGDLLYAYRPHGGAWSKQSLDASGVTGAVSALAFAPDGALHATYYTCGDLSCTNDGIKHAVLSCP